MSATEDEVWVAERDELVFQAMAGTTNEPVTLRSLVEGLRDASELNTQHSAPELLLALKTLLQDPTATQQAWAAIEKAEP